jgi:hypothetical protein
MLANIGEELDGSAVNLMQYTYHDVVVRGITKRKLHLASQHVSVAELMPQLQTCLEDYMTHSLNAAWQADQYMRCIQGLPHDDYIVQIDFSENASFDYDREVQSAHFDAGSRQCTLLIAITRHWEVDGVSDDGQLKYTGKMMKVVHAAISDDRTHDPFFVEYFLAKVHEEVVSVMACSDCTVRMSSGSSRVSASHCPLPAAFCLPPAACCQVLSAQPAGCCLLPVASCLLPAASCLLPAACCPLPAADCLLPAACCLLPAACPVPGAQCPLDSDPLVASWQPAAAAGCRLPAADCLQASQH